jgi:hypothetical protein
MQNRYHPDSMFAFAAPGGISLQTLLPSFILSFDAIWISAIDAPSGFCFVEPIDELLLIVSKQSFERAQQPREGEKKRKKTGQIGNVLNRTPSGIGTAHGAPCTGVKESPINAVIWEIFGHKRLRY